MHQGGTRETIAFMTNPQTIERVRELRQRGRTPKEIARALGLTPAAVAPPIRAVAAAKPTREAALVGCCVSEGWAAGLTVTGHPDPAPLHRRRQLPLSLPDRLAESATEL